MEKTNVMRILEQKKIKYNSYEYEHTDKCVDGNTVASILNQDPNKVFKTLVTVGKTKNYYVFVIPVASELDFKKAASAVNEKSIEMIAVKDITTITGYVRGGCSPIGMKKQYKTVLDETAKNFDTIIFSAGKIGYQVEIAPKDLVKLINCRLFDIQQKKL